MTNRIRGASLASAPRCPRIICAALALCVALSLPLGSARARSARKNSHRVSRVLAGIDVLESQKFAALRGKHVGLITNHTGVDAQGRSDIDLLTRAPGVHLIALFSPEHGLAGRRDEKVSSD